MLQYWVHTLKASALLLLWLLYNLWLIHPLVSHLIIIITWMRTNSWSMWSLSFQGLCTLKERIRERWFSTRVIWYPRGHLAMPEDILNYQFWGEEVSGIWWLGILPNILQGTGQLPWTQNHLIPNVGSSEIEKPCSRTRAEKHLNEVDDIPSRQNFSSVWRHQTVQTGPPGATVS